MANDAETTVLLGPAEIRALADILDIRPTKKLGQNFLHDPNTIRRIVATATISSDTDVLEVGPGLGSLTLGLLERGHRVCAVEIDPRLARQLPQTVADRLPSAERTLCVIEHDALTVTRDTIEQRCGYSPQALVANLPYNVAVPVLLHLLAQLPTLRRVLIMVQAEVADRLAAQPGAKTYGVPSVKASFYGTVKRAGAIGKNVFWPAPNIDSGLVAIDVFPDGQAPWPTDPATRAAVFTLVDAAFAQRRKTLRAALGGVCGGSPRAEELLRGAGIDPTRRGETLTAADFVELAVHGRACGMLTGSYDRCTS